MSPKAFQPDLTPAEEALLLSAVEGGTPPDQGVALDRLLDRYPSLRGELAGMRADRRRLSDLQFDLPHEPDFVDAVLARLEPCPLHLQRMDVPRRRRGLRWTGAAVQRLAAAAAVLIIVGFSALYLRTPSPSPGAAGSADQGMAELRPGDEPAWADAGGGMPEAEVTPPEPERVLAVAEQAWKADRTQEPDVARAAGLLADGRLVIRVLAPSDEQARRGLAAMRAGIEHQSTAWQLAGRLSPTLASRWDAPSASPTVLAYDGQAEAMIEVPRPRLLEVWSARVEVDPTAIASLVRALERVGWTVWLEESPEPIPLEPDALESAIWWDQSPSTWKVSSSVPIVIDAIRR
ncbi:MAG: hypothetical protein Kow0022_07000 [Phycisphaerales bacterium]